MKKYLILAITLSFFLYSRAEGVFRLNTSKEELKHISVNKMFTKNDTIFSSTKGEISGLCINGTFEKKSVDYLIRIILVDKAGHEHLVLESYDMLNSDFKVMLSDYCEETFILENVAPDFIKVFVNDAILTIENIGYIVGYPKGSQRAVDQARRKNDVMREQKASIIKRINTYNASHGRPWIAGNTGLSDKSYEEKKRLLGFPDDASTYGYEYYYDGYFIMGNLSANRSTTSSDYVSSFDWRNRHGKNWVTPVKDQGDSNCCVAFASAACMESIYMLYYNDTTNIDLSEAEIAFCPNPLDSVYKYGQYKWEAMRYLRDFGVHDESLNKYRFMDNPTQTCMKDDDDNNEVVRITKYDSLEYKHFDDSIKHWVINYGPIMSGFWGGSLGHSMQMVGFDELTYESLVRFYSDSGLGVQGEFPYDLIGNTYWIFKNSKGGLYDSNLGGYRYIIFGNDGPNNIHNWYMNRCYKFCTPIISTRKIDADIICEDADGDGYYYWGIKPTKPAWCPSWIPEKPDGDDSDSSKGYLYTDRTNSHLIGDYKNLTVDESFVLPLTGNQSYSTRQSFDVNISITSGSTFTVYDILNMLGRVTITVQPGGHLTVDGGVITNVKLNMASGSKLTLRNNGKLVMRTNTDFYAPAGALVDIESGEIIRSNDF